MGTQPESVLYVGQPEHPEDATRDRWTEFGPSAGLRVETFDGLASQCYERDRYEGRVTHIDRPLLFRLVELGVEGISSPTNPLNTGGEFPRAGLVAEAKSLFTKLEFAGLLSPDAMRRRLGQEGVGDRADHVAELAAVSLTPELRDRVNTHAQRGIGYVDEQTADVDVEHQYDELYVTAEFERGEISGFIDHLIITPDAYHIIDYKTGDVIPDELEADARYYENQMTAYAIALNQQETGRSVRVSLVFTTLGDAWETEWSPTEIASMREQISDEIWEQFDSLER